MINNQEALFFSDAFTMLDKYTLSYAYSGEFTAELTDHILSLVETSMEVESETSKTKKKVYFIMVESLQNITRHQTNSDKDEFRSGFFSIHKTNNGYLITSGNNVRKEDVSQLKEKLEKLNSLDEGELREYHKMLLSSAELSSKGGAGLGLIEMLRKSNNKLMYDFVPLENDNTYFYFQANITPNQNESENLLESNLSIKFTENIHNLILNHKLKTVFHGQFGHENVRGLLSMAKKDISDVKLRKTMISAVVEMLQNVCYHADGKVDFEGEGPGMFIIKDNGNSYSLITVNFIESTKAEALANYIQFINSLDKEQLKKLFLERLMKDKYDLKPFEGLGLLDIRIKTNNLIQISINKITEELSHLVLISQVNY